MFDHNTDLKILAQSKSAKPHNNSSSVRTHIRERRVQMSSKNNGVCFLGAIVSDVCGAAHHGVLFTRDA